MGPLDFQVLVNSVLLDFATLVIYNQYNLLQAFCCGSVVGFLFALRVQVQFSHGHIGNRC